MFKRALIFSMLLSSFLTGCGSQTDLLQPEIISPVPQNIADNDQQAEAEGIFDRKISTIILDVMEKYDHNRSLGIDYRSTDTFFKTITGKNENIRNERYMFDNKLSNTVYTMGKLFIGSDTDHDGIATKEEIESFIRKTYDLNNDGLLQSRGLKIWQPKNEYQLYKAEVGEEVKSRTDIDFSNNDNQNNNHSNTSQNPNQNNNYGNPGQNTNQNNNHGTVSQSPNQNNNNQGNTGQSQNNYHGSPGQALPAMQPVVAKP
jgi:hypothetical protein